MVKKTVNRRGLHAKFRKTALTKAQKSSVKKIAQKVVNKNAEWKRRLDYSSGVGMTSLTGHVLFDGPQIVVGDGAEQRDGLTVMLRKLRFKLQCAYKGIPTKVRLIGARYPQGSSSPSLSDLLTHPTATQAFYSPWLKAGPVKYDIFCNKTVNLGGEAEMAGTYKEKYLNFDIKLKGAGQKLTYEDGTTQTPDKNRYVLYAVPNYIPAIATDRPIISHFVETSFTDM